VLSFLVFWNCFITAAAGEPGRAPLGAGCVAAGCLAAEPRRGALSPEVPVGALRDVGMESFRFPRL
jgi:hypothetical protein